MHINGKPYGLTPRQERTLRELLSAHLHSAERESSERRAARDARQQIGSRFHDDDPDRPQINWISAADGGIVELAHATSSCSRRVTGCSVASALNSSQPTALTVSRTYADGRQR